MTDFWNRVTTLLIFAFIASLGIEVIVDGVPEPDWNSSTANAALTAFGRMSGHFGDFWTGIVIIVLAFIVAIGFRTFPRRDDHRSLPRGPAAGGFFFGGGDD